MMEKANIQLDNANMTRMDSFVEAVCDEWHLDNYYATISVAVTNAVEYAMAKGNATVMLSYGHCDKGIGFTLYCKEGTFGTLMTEMSAVTDLPASETSFLVKTLSDDLRVAADGTTLQVIFAVQGIDPRDCAARIAVLEKFYQPTLVEA